MRALTLTQPWATLVAIGEKRVETRSWHTHFRGPVAIHAAKGLAYPVMNETGLSLLIESEPFASVLRPHLSGYTAEERAADLPRGAIVGVATIDHVLPTGLTLHRSLTARGYVARRVLSEQELAFGDYGEGRYAWILGRRVQVSPIECVGARGLWSLPESVRQELRPLTDMAWTEDELAAYQDKLNDLEIEEARTR